MMEEGEEDPELLAEAMQSLSKPPYMFFVYQTLCMHVCARKRNATC